MNKFLDVIVLAFGCPNGARYCTLIARNVISMAYLDYELNKIIFWTLKSISLPFVWRELKAKRMVSRPTSPTVVNLNFNWSWLNGGGAKLTRRQKAGKRENRLTIISQWPWVHGGGTAWRISNETLHTSNSNDRTRKNVLYCSLAAESSVSFANVFTFSATR